jgi:hypothetical protein
MQFYLVEAPLALQAFLPLTPPLTSLKLHLAWLPWLYMYGNLAPFLPYGAAFSASNFNTLGCPFRKRSALL